ncbi:MAG TPA: ATP-binding protein [Candidatus Bathyarchaeia archaeon]|nr:ATP-binding protein [Candidatus Bathyarchaeia archaeon]
MSEQTSAARALDAGHFVQFYDGDASLIDALAAFVGAGLSAGEPCLVIATPEHRQALEAQLAVDGLDLSHFRATADYVALDAARTLDRIVVDDAPDPQRFARVMGELLPRSGSGRRPRVFGEMVGLLLARGHVEATLRLETLWNELRDTHHFRLFCAYPISQLGDRGLAQPIAEICRHHARVVPAESFPAHAPADERLRAIVRLQQQAASLQAEVAERHAVEAALRAAKEELEAQVEDLRRLRAEAEAANRMKDEFLSTVSHELRTPLNAILGWAHILRGGRSDEAIVARGVEVIERNAQTQAQLIEAILDASRAISGSLSLARGPVDLATVVDRAIDSFRRAAREKRIELAMTLEPDARQVEGDTARLQQAVANVISNAVKFTEPGGRIEVRLTRVGDFAQIRVTDSGEGIAADFLPFVFDPFRQADSTITRRHGGLGLGLTIVRHLVGLHGGTVGAESAGPGYGASFTIRLPLGSREPAPPAGVAGAPPAPLHDVDVLVVDDDRDALDTLAVSLTAAGARVRTAASASEGLVLMRWLRPDVVVSDLAMPEEDGYAFMHGVRALEREDGRRRVPAIALSAYVRVQDRARAVAAGFDLFVEKPVDPVELISVIVGVSERDGQPGARSG